jgi:tRNA pseudouridine38-40 synthase
MSFPQHDSPIAPGLLRIRLRLAYEGKAFQGWQSQPEGHAVQDHLEAAFQRLCGHRIVVHGSGRTDAGVHALGQVAHVDVPPRPVPPERWKHALNAFLPDQIRVLSTARVSARFHARFSASGKVYLYRVWNDSSLHPMEVGRAWHLPGRIDGALLEQAARSLEGTHNFAAFAANRGVPVESTVRTVHRIGIRRSGALITLSFRGNGFLYRMVRLLTGSLMRCAQGRASLDWLRELLEGGGARKTSFSAPAEGLYLKRVLY